MFAWVCSSEGIMLLSARTKQKHTMKQLKLVSKVAAVAFADCLTGASTRVRLRRAFGTKYFSICTFTPTGLKKPLRLRETSNEKSVLPNLKEKNFDLSK